MCAADLVTQQVTHHDLHLHLATTKVGQGKSQLPSAELDASVLTSRRHPNVVSSVVFPTVRGGSRRSVARLESIAASYTSRKGCVLAAQRNNLAGLCSLISLCMCSMVEVDTCQRPFKLAVRSG